MAFADGVEKERKQCGFTHEWALADETLITKILKNQVQTDVLKGS